MYTHTYISLPHALILGLAHWDPAHAASRRQARSPKQRNKATAIAWPRRWDSDLYYF